MQITKDDLEDLRKHYVKSKDDGKSQFIWRGHKLLTDYAGYLIQYADTRFAQI